MGLFLTDPRCIRQRAFVNVNAWMDAGIAGKGLTIFHDDIDKTHSECCVDIIRTILPAARVLSGSISYKTEKHEVTECTIACRETGERMVFSDFIEKYDVSQINNSTSGRASDDLDTPIARYMRDMIRKYNLFCTGSAGNSDSKNNKFKGAFIMVSGVYFFKDTDEIRDYGPAWDFIDFSMFMTFQTGTSFAAPFLNGMGGLLRSRYGRDIRQDEIYKYFKNHCYHLGNPGKNPEYGWGIPVMGSLYEKFEEGERMTEIEFSSLPVDAPLRITSKFGERSTGISGASKSHAGVDLGRNINSSKTKILAVKAGTVVSSYWNEIRGWVIVIKHNEKYSTLYQHMASKSPFAVSARVKAGDIIGVMGSTGVSSGTHLHFELHENGKPVDPQPYLQNLKREVTTMTENEIREIIRDELRGNGSDNSPWFKKEFAGKEKELAAITDGTRMQGYAKREEVAAMIARALGL